MAEDKELHDLRRRAHEAGIEGNSKMNVDELRSALRDVQKGEKPQQAKQEAKKDR